MQASCYLCWRINYFTKPHQPSSFLLSPTASSPKISGCNTRGKKTPTSEWLFCVKPFFSPP